MARRAGLFACAAAAVAVGGAGARPAGPLAAKPPTARAAACFSLGAAEGFAVFSHGKFTAAQVGGTTITGRIAAGSTVTLDGAVVRPGPGDEPPTIITGASLSAGRTLGLGGRVDGGVRYAAVLSVAPNFTVSPPRHRLPPPFSFNDEFLALGLLSDRWSELPPTPGATVTFSNGTLTFRGSSPGLNVFRVGAADVGGSAANVSNIAVELPDEDASALINVDTITALTIAPGGLTVTPAGGADRLIWNLPRATALNVTRGVAWQGLILAPNADVSGSNHPQLEGQLIAKSVPGGEWLITGTPLAVCPRVPPSHQFELRALCVDPFGNLAMRLRNVGTDAAAVHWDDLGGLGFGDFVARAGRDQFFNVPGGGVHSAIRATAQGITVGPVAGTDQPCAGEITVTKLTAGEAPPGPWTVQLTGGDGRLTRSARLGPGESVTFDALGGYQPGSARLGQVVGGILYTVSEPDPLGGTATVSHNPVEILTGQYEAVAVLNSYPGGGVVAPRRGGEQPTLPPGAPRPPPGPDLIGAAPGEPAADLAVTHTIRPRRLLVGGTVRTLTRVRNRGAVAAVGTVLGELPQFRARDANAVARVVSITTSQGRCTHRRPVRCALCTLTPGAEVTVRSRVRIGVAAPLNSVVLASSRTTESNTTNNTGLAPLTVAEPEPHLRLRVSAPSRGRVGSLLSYRVSVTGTGPHGARSVRLCALRPTDVTGLRAPATFAYGRARCRNIRRLARGRTVSINVAAVPAAGGRLTLTARATAAGLAGAASARSQVPIAAPAACPSALRTMLC
jgi:choice-of-anchor A domain-containing protein